MYLYAVRVVSICKLFHVLRVYFFVVCRSCSPGECIDAATSGWLLAWFAVVVAGTALSLVAPASRVSTSAMQISKSETDLHGLY